jgi:tetratricopeptide (TPR) repeat protein
LALADGQTDKGFRQIEGSVINRARWERDKTDHILERQNLLSEAAASASLNDRKKRQLELARFLGANALYREAAAAFISAFNSRIEKIDEPRDRLELGILQALGADWRPAWENLSDIRLTDHDEAILWRAYLAAKSGHFKEALDDFRRSGSAIGQYPDDVQIALRMAFAEAAVESGDWGLAEEMERALRAKVSGVQFDMLDYFHARIEEGRGALEEARKAYEGLLHNGSRGIEVRATLAITALDLKIAQIDPAKALEIYENLAVFWRGDFLEAKVLANAARVALDTKKWRNAFTAVQRLNRLYADTDGVRPLLEEVTLRFDALIGGDQPDAIAPVDAVALFMEFREFMPTGRRADELIRKYIERLVDLDLIPQASELLRYQIEYRLEGTPRAAAAVRLASLYLMDHKPIDAVRVIAETRANGLPDELRMDRRLLEARARADIGQIKAATELLEGLDTREAAIVRADVYWKAKNWILAGENYERALGDAWRSDGALAPDDLKIALRTAASYVMAGDTLANDRFRGRYRDKLAATPESGVFRLLTAPVTIQKPIAAGVTTDKGDAGLLDSFLKSYRAHYGLGGNAAAIDGAPPVIPKPAG